MYMYVCMYIYIYHINFILRFEATPSCSCISSKIVYCCYFYSNNLIRSPSVLLLAFPRHNIVNINKKTLSKIVYLTCSSSENRIDLVLIKCSFQMRFQEIIDKSVSNYTTLLIHYIIDSI